jgi:hypothetical protein
VLVTGVTSVFSGESVRLVWDFSIAASEDFSCSANSRLYREDRAAAEDGEVIPRFSPSADCLYKCPKPSFKVPKLSGLRKIPTATQSGALVTRDSLQASTSKPANSSSAVWCGLGKPRQFSSCEVSKIGRWH